MKRTAYVFVMILLATAASLVNAQTRELGGSGELLDGVAALVDEGVVLKSELRNRIRTVAENFALAQANLPPEQRGELPPLSILEQQVLDQLILEEIQVQRASRVGIEIGDDLLNTVLTGIADAIGISLSELPGWLQSQGVDYAQFREDQRRDVMIRELERAEIMRSIRINPRELEQCMEQTVRTVNSEFEYNISHILIDFSPDVEGEEEAAETLVRDIARQLDEGADFAEMALTWSDSGTALEGGNLGWRKGSELPTIFAADVTSMEVGEHSRPIRGGAGFHIVRLNDLRGREAELEDQVEVRHILMTTTEVLDDEATRQRLSGIRDQIIAGDDFASVASALSEDTETAIDGGNIGWSTLEPFDPAFAAVVAGLEIGEVSEPFQTSFGWHIAEVTGRRSYDVTDDRREDNCRNEIGNGKAVEELDLWRQRIWNDAYIVRKL